MVTKHNRTAHLDTPSHEPPRPHTSAPSQSTRRIAHWTPCFLSRLWQGTAYHIVYGDTAAA
ncbi:hypothetical protein E2C01_063805 [Portunus trituberculatus]|uniref:Uncharacterized protein n=1 Tax=Portunus trituberculatus TaxID=210409 RepID=A0A5B7HI27_PORTR|nr:hypothetical protein [Portunus trituberculatus]